MTSPLPSGASRSWSEVARHLGDECSGGIHRFLKAHIVHRGLDTSHFTGQRWARGQTFPGRRARSLDELLVEHSTYQAERDDAD